MKKKRVVFRPAATADLYRGCNVVISTSRKYKRHASAALIWHFILCMMHDVLFLKL